MGALSPYRTRIRRLIDSRSEPLRPGRVPLDLCLTGSSEECPTFDEICQVRSGKIPERSLPELRKAARAAAHDMTMTYIGVLWFGAAFFYPPWTWPWFAVGSVDLLCIYGAIRCTLHRRRLLHDLRERRLRVREGSSTCKWIGSAPILSEKEEAESLISSRGLSRWGRLKRWYAHFIRDLFRGDDAETKVYWVEIEGETHEISSVPLFSELGSGVCYRMHLSEHAGQLVAIEAEEQQTLSNYRVRRIHKPCTMDELASDQRQQK